MLEGIFITVLVALGAGMVPYFAFKPLWRLKLNAKRLARTGIGEVGYVVEIQQTGDEINGIPEMQVVLDIHPAGGTRRQVTVKQLIDLGSIPRAGDTVYLVTDPEDLNTVLIADGPKTQPVIRQALARPPQLTEAQELDLMALTPRLGEHGVRGVATVLAVEPGEGQSTRFHLEVDSIIEAKREVTVTQVIYGETYTAGERAYLLIDPEDRNVIALLPLSLTGGHKPGPHRLDKRVLGPQLMREGAKAQGTVLGAERVAAPVLESMGHAKIRLHLLVVPDDGSESYEADQELIFSSEEKIRRWGTIGAALPLRYDWHDHMTICGDLMSLGYPDPYAEFEVANRARIAAYTKANSPVSKITASVSD